MRSPRPSGLVYSSEHGTMCPACGHPAARCTCKEARSSRALDGPVIVGRETKGRQGKGVTVISRLPLGTAEIAALARALKMRCGSGGTVKGDVIEIQGDHRDLLIAELTRRGWAVKRSGG